jgi:hypothetical protein
MFLLKVLPMFYPQKIKNAVTYSVTTFCEKLYALCLVVPPGIEPFALVYSNSLSDCTFIALSLMKAIELALQ